MHELFSQDYRRLALQISVFRSLSPWINKDGCFQLREVKASRNANRDEFAKGSDDESYSEV